MFQRNIPLCVEIEGEKVNAKLDKGLLTITAKKAVPSISTKKTNPCKKGLNQ
jgi:HSP20 family molecular chaperone IbpA